MLDIKTFLDLDELQRIQDQFSDATGLAAIAVDTEGNYITKGSNFTDFCMKYTRGCQEGLRRCVKCDNECKGTYFCHAGLMDFASDILIEGERVGSIIGGQALPSKPDPEQFRVIARELGIDEEAYLAALKKVPIRSEKTIRSAADLLINVVSQLVNLSYFKYINKEKIEVFGTERKNATNAVNAITQKMQDLQQVASMENVLAINASIEANRAGRAGVGFAVVAREIGKLAHQSASVYEEIHSLVSEVQNSIRHMDQVDLRSSNKIITR